MRAFRIVLAAALAVGCLHVALPAASRAAEGDGETLGETLRRYGHGNWVVVADMSFPALARPGVKTIYVGGDHLKIIGNVLKLVDQAPHVKGVLHVCQELGAVSDAEAPGIEQMREQMAAAAKERTVRTAPREDLMQEFERAAGRYQVLVLKTDTKLPFTSLFIELKSVYWNEEPQIPTRGSRRPRH